MTCCFLIKELEKLGVKFVKTDNKEIIQEGEHKGEQYSDAYGKKSKKSKAKRKKSVDGDPLEAISRSATSTAMATASRRVSCSTSGRPTARRLLIK